MSKILGIDLGTTNSAMAVMEGSEPEILVNAEEAINEAKTALAGSDIEAIKAATEKLQQAGYKLAEVAYSQQGADQAAGAAAGAQSDDGPIEADYEVVDDKEGK